MQTGVWAAGMVLLLLPATSVGQRDRHDVRKQAETPDGTQSGPVDRMRRGATTQAGLSDAVSWTQFRDVRQHLQLVLSQSKASGHVGSDPPELSRHVDASTAKLVAMQRLNGGRVAFVEANFVNESHQAARRHRTWPHTPRKRRAEVLPVVAMFLPFIVWIGWLVFSIRRTLERSFSVHRHVDVALT